MAEVVAQTLQVTRKVHWQPVQIDKDCWALQKKPGEGYATYGDCRPYVEPKDD